MKIGFVSLMRVADWGGSEELWSKTALRALNEGFEIESLTFGWNPTSSRIAKLQQAGVDTKFYHSNSAAKIDRILVRLGVKKGRSETTPSMDSDIYVISNGNIWDFLRLKPITDYIISLGKPYVIIGHNTLDWGDILDSEQRAYAITVMQNAARVLFVSERNRKGAERQLAHLIPNTQIVSNPLSTRNNSIKPFPASDTLLMASVGTLDCVTKGQDLLLEALSGEAWKGRDFVLKIYGRGHHEQYLNTLIELYGLQGKVILAGHVSDVDQIWEINQVLVLSSTTEGVPMVVVEAMLSGRAVLGTDVGAVDQYVKEGETGFLVAVAKAKYLAQGLEKLWDSRNTLKQMGESAFQRAVAITNAHPEESFLGIIKSCVHPS